jgi:hypothetical protein
MHPLSTSCTFLLVTMLALPVGARAAEPQPASAAPEAPQPAAGAAFGAAADDDLLERARGGSDLTVIDTKLTGAVAGNAATNVTTGWNVIQGGSFANMSGIPIVVQNTGANVLIQNATVINLQLK